MDTKHTYLNLIDRVEAQLDKLPRLSQKQLNYKAAGHPNTIAWSLWHAGRVLDAMIAPVEGREQLWETADFKDKFNLGEAGDGTGFGHTAADCGQVVVVDKQLLVDYIKASLDALRAYVRTFDDKDWDEIIGEWQGAPEKRQDRISLVLVDALQHIGQAAFLAGAPHNK